MCCRVSPAQKAQVVSMVKDNVKGSVTLGIGDGANDVAMIQTAHLGIGISGFEGLQAVMASDYAISQFKYLKNLLLVHGYWNYRRTAKLIIYSFYKNIGVSFTQVLFAFYNGFSGQMYYNAFAGTLFNVVFLAFPVLFLAVFNREVKAETLLENPSLYKSGQMNCAFNLPMFGVNVVEGLLHGVLCFYVAKELYGQNVDPRGLNEDHGMWAQVACTYFIILVTVKVCFETLTWTTYSFVIIFLSAMSWIGFVGLYDLMAVSSFGEMMGLEAEFYGVGPRLLGDPKMYLGLMWVVAVGMLPSILYFYFQKEFRPTVTDVVREMDKGFGTKKANKVHPETPNDTL